MEAAAFFLEHGRAPHLGRDPIAPWHYRGWLRTGILSELCWIPSEIVAEKFPVLDRWLYHLETYQSGRFLDRPIPQLSFSPSSSIEREVQGKGARSKPKKVFSSVEGEKKRVQDWCAIIGRDCGGWSDFRTFLDWLSWGFGTCEEEPKIDEAKAERLYREVDLKPWLIHPYDYLGSIISEQKAAGWNPHAFFPTPAEVCDLMCRMQMGDALNQAETRHLSVCDPCVGSARMLLAASQFSMNLYGMDIDPVMVAVSKINLAMYAPWAVWPLPATLLDQYRNPTQEVQAHVASLDGLEVETQSAMEPLLQLPAPEAPMYRINDCGQGLLFDV